VPVQRQPAAGEDLLRWLRAQQREHRGVPDQSGL